MRRHFAAALALLVLPMLAQALPSQRDGVPVRHYILESAVPLDAAASAELAAQGIEVQRPLASNRYLVRMRDDVATPRDARIRSIRSYDASHKIARAAYVEATKGAAFARLQILFQPEVTFEEAQAAIDAVGGTIDTPLTTAYAHPRRLTVRVPSMTVTDLAKDERVFGVYGPPLHPISLNAVAAQISKVTPLFSAPYNLSGAGVVMAIFEPDGSPDVAHQEFGGRVINHFASTRPVNFHATHTSGTITASGVNPAAKGMSPAATLHAYDANVDFAEFLDTKAKGPVSVGAVADSNSWDFGLSWQQTGANQFEWYGNDDAYGAYSALESEPYDALMRLPGAPLIVHAAGNDAEQGNPPLLTPWSPHKHLDDTPKEGTHIFCYSQNGSGTDCPAAVPFSCSAGVTYCETTKHATHGANGIIGLMASTKNSITVGAIEADGGTIAPFSSRGPTVDGRLKPEVVAKGVSQFSTYPNNSYASLQGTSMSTPVVAGIAGILTEQYRKTFSKTPSAVLLKTLIIAGADDIGPAGPDYAYGFGLADAKASADLIIADNNTGSRIRTGTVGNGQDIDFTFTLSAAQKFRAVLGWFDPEVLLVPDPTIKDDDPLADKTLINDLDLRVVDPNGATVLPYVLDKGAPNALATRGVNHTDTTEEVEIANAVPGTYHIIVHGAIGDARSPTQDFVLVVNGGTPVPPCTDNYEPNDTQATAFGNLVSGQAITPRICPSDIDYFTFGTNSSPISVTVAATDTPLKVTLSSNFSTTVTQTIATNSSATLTTNLFATILPVPNTAMFVRVEANGTVGASGTYTLTPNYHFVSNPRKRSTKH
jgi:subtilisin family serine protease